MGEKNNFFCFLLWSGQKKFQNHFPYLNTKKLDNHISHPALLTSFLIYQEHPIPIPQAPSPQFHI